MGSGTINHSCHTYVLADYQPWTEHLIQISFKSMQCQGRGQEPFSSSGSNSQPMCQRCYWRSSVSAHGLIALVPHLSLQPTVGTSIKKQENAQTLASDCSKKSIPVLIMYNFLGEDSAHSELPLNLSFVHGDRFWLLNNLFNIL